MKHRFKLRFMILMLALCFICITVYAHPGRTDANGGHYDHSTGEYHYHHGYPAHEHNDTDGDGDLDCPYNFDDKTGQNSNASGSSPGATGSGAEDSNDVSVLDVLHAMLISLFPAILIGAGISYLLFYVFFLIFGENKSRLVTCIAFFTVFLIAYIWLIIHHFT